MSTVVFVEVVGCVRIKRVQYAIAKRAPRYFAECDNCGTLTPPMAEQDTVRVLSAEHKCEEVISTV